MEKFKQLLEQLQSLKLIQKKSEWQECLPEEIWDEHFNDRVNYKELKEGLSVDTHRWYETSVSVIEIYNGLLGIRHITNIFSESSGYEDCYVTIDFFEMEEVQEIAYKKK